MSSRMNEKHSRQCLPSHIRDKKIRFSSLHLSFAVSSKEADCLATCTFTALDTCRSIFKHHTYDTNLDREDGWLRHERTVFGFYSAFLCSQEIGIRTDNEIDYHRCWRDTIDETHAGFPILTSSATTKASGTSIPAFASAERAYSRVAEVHIAQHGFG